MSGEQRSLWRGVSGGFVLLAVVSVAHGQFMVPRGPANEPQPFEFKYDALTYFEQGTDQRGQDLYQLRQSADLKVPLFSGENNALTFISRFGVVHTETNARIPRRGLFDRSRTFPSELYDLRLGTLYTHELNNGWTLSLNTQIGSMSDGLFASDEEWLLASRASLRIPIEGTDDAWVLLADMSNNREFLEGAPIPGFGYEMNRGPEFRGFFGLPFNRIQWQPIEKWELVASHMIMRQIDLEVSYRPIETVKLYGGYRWWNERYLLTTRSEPDERLWHYEQRVGGGVRWDFLQSAWLDFSAGWAFDNYWFLGKNYDDRREGRIDIDDGPYLRLQVGFSF